jgi:TorA maturation chaperone TorD
MSATTYEQATPRRRPGIYPKQIATDIGEALLNWLARIGERSANGRASARYQRLNALTDAQLARMDMKRTDLLERCYGWRAYY